MTSPDSMHETGHSKPVVKGQEIGQCFLDIIETSAPESTSPENCL